MHSPNVATLICRAKGKQAQRAGVETYYCLWQTVGDDLVFEVEVIDPKDNQRDV